MEAEGRKQLNGGWGWMVVAAAALINFVNQSLFANYGLIFGEKLKEMSHGHATALTLVMSINIVVTNFAGLLVGPLLKKFDIRTITLFGIANVGTGMIISSFGTEVWHIIVGYSCMLGVGLGMIASGTFLAIDGYFTTKKSTAVGISMAGTGLGQMVMPTLVGELLQRYGFSITAFTLGVMSFSGIIGTLMFKPVLCCKKWGVADESVESGTQEDAKKMDENFNNGKKKEIAGNREEQKTLLDTKLPQERKKKQSMIRVATENNFQDTAMGIASSQHLDKIQKENITWYMKVSKAIGLHLLKDFTFVHIMTGLGIGYVSVVTFSAFFPMFLQDELGYTVMETTYFMTAFSFTDVVGRITAAELCRKMKLGNRKSFMLGCALMAAARSCLVETSGFAVVMAMSMVSGYTRAIVIINQNLAISEYITKEDLPSAIGLNMVSKAIFTMTVGQTLGILTDQFSYGFCIHILDIFLVVVLLCWFVEILIKRCKRES